MSDPVGANDVRTTPLPRGIVVIVAVTGLLVSTLALRQFADIAAPVLLALVLVIGTHPLTDLLHRRGLPRPLAASVTLIATFAIVVGLALAMALSVARLGTLLPLYEDRFTTLLGDLQSWLTTLGVGDDQLRAVLDQISFGKIAGIVANLVLGLVGTVSNLVFLLLVILFMGIDATHFPARLRHTSAGRPALIGALAGFARGTRRYLLVTTVFGLIVAVIDGLFLWLVDVPLVPMWALLAFVTNYIPNIGFVLGLAPPALLGLLEGGPQLMLAVIGAYCVINFVIQSVIQPKFVGDAVQLSLVLAFLSLVFWSFVIGPVGAVLAIPLTLLAKALLLDADPDTRWIAVLLSGGSVAQEPTPEDDEPDPDRNADHP